VRGRRALIAGLRWLFLAATAGVISWQVGQQWDAVRLALVTVGPGALLASLVATVVGLGATGMAWRSLLSGLGSTLSPGAAAGIFFVAQLGKYLPGSVWPYVAQAEIGRTFGVPRSLTAAAGVWFVLLHCASGGIVAVAVLPTVGDRVLTERFGWLPVLLPLFVGLLHPRVVHAALARAHRLLRRGAPPQQVPWSTVLSALLALVVAWGCYGAALFFLIAPLAGVSWEGAALSLGGFALAWTAGFLAAAVLVVAAPAGLGVRELVLYSVLAPVLTGGPATTVLVLSRIGHLVGDVLWAAVGAAWARRLRRSAPLGGGSDESQPCR
jgi:uncharacterized membrane protein YbhN (UPF0104 family)